MWLVYTMTSDVNSVVFGIMVYASQWHGACVHNDLLMSTLLSVVSWSLPEMSARSCNACVPACPRSSVLPSHSRTHAFLYTFFSSRSKV